MTTLLLREHETPKGVLLAVCDAETLGETYTNGEVSLTVREPFYDGDPADEGQVVNALGRAAVANIVGTQSVTVAIDAGFVDPDRILDVDGIPHAQAILR